MDMYGTVVLGPIGRGIVDFVDSRYAKKNELNVTSGEDGDHGSSSFHYEGTLSWNGSPCAAIDFGGYDKMGIAEGDRAMRDFSKWCLDTFPDLCVELIHTTPYPDDNGFYLKYGRWTSYDGQTMASHRNHVHLAMSANSLAAARQRVVQPSTDLIDDPNFAALAWRVEALVNGRATVAGGPTKGEKVAFGNLLPALTDIQVGLLAEKVASVLAAAPHVSLGDADIPAIKTAVSQVIKQVFTA